MFARREDTTTQGQATAPDSPPSMPESAETGQVGAARIVDALGAAVLRLSPVRELEATLHAIVTGVVNAVPGAEHAGITEVASDSTISSRASTDEQVAAFDRLQAETAEGPCLDALGTERTVRVDDLAAESDRWPAFAPGAVNLGAASILSFRLSAEGATTLTALNLYSTSPEVFDKEARLLGELFASHAGIALAHVRNAEHLTFALNSRDVIGQAKGILQERFGITDHEAFTMLVDSSQRTNLKLVTVARWLTGTTDSDTTTK